MLPLKLILTLTLLPYLGHHLGFPVDDILSLMQHSVAGPYSGEVIKSKVKVKKHTVVSFSVPKIRG